MLNNVFRNIVPSNRAEVRSLLKYLVEVKIIGEPGGWNIEALTTEINDTSLSMLTTLPLPVGTCVEINEGCNTIVCGEITNLSNWKVINLESCRRYNLFRLDIRITGRE